MEGSSSASAMLFETQRRVRGNYVHINILLSNFIFLTFFKIFIVSQAPILLYFFIFLLNSKISQGLTQFSGIKYILNLRKLRINIIMATKILLLSSTTLLLGGLYYRKKQKFYQQLFEQLRKCPKFHTDYVEDVSHLPVNKQMILFGPPNSDDGEQLISPSFIKKQNQQDRLWKIKLKNTFSLFTSALQPIKVESSQKQILVFNLPQTKRQLKDKSYEQRAIVHGVGLCVYGKLQKQGNNYRMLTNLLIGNKHESFLTFLDSQIISLSRKSKILTGIGSLFLLGHAIYYNIFVGKEKTDIEKEMQEMK